MLLQKCTYKMHNLEQELKRGERYVKLCEVISVLNAIITKFPSIKQSLIPGKYNFIQLGQMVSASGKTQTTVFV